MKRENKIKSIVSNLDMEGQERNMAQLERIGAAME